MMKTLLLETVNKMDEFPLQMFVTNMNLARQIVEYHKQNNRFEREKDETNLRKLVAFLVATLIVYEPKLKPYFEKDVWSRWKVLSLLLAA